MRQSHSEIKAIEAELRSIRAEKTAPHARSVTLLDPNKLEPTNHSTEPVVQPISPTIVRQPSPQSGASNRQKSTQPAQKRSIECFPFPSQHKQQHNSADAVLQSQLTAVVEQLRQRSVGSGQSSEYSSEHTSKQQSKSALSRSSQRTAESRDTIWKLLDERAQYINHLSAQQETIILELMAILEQLEQALEQNAEPIFECLTAEVPHVERDRNGALILTTRSIDWFQPEVTTAAALRYRARHQNRNSLLHVLVLIGRTLWRLPWGLLRTVGTITSALLSPVARMLFGHSISERTTAVPRRKTYRGVGTRTTAQETPFTLQSAATLVLGSALLRIGLDWIVASYPMLWIPSILVMLTPALIAVYRSTVSPQAGFVWGYRLFSIMIGLLLGGRL